MAIMSDSTPTAADEMAPEIASFFGPVRFAPDSYLPTSFCTFSPWFPNNMPTLLARNAEILVTMDGQRRELKSAGIYAEDGFIKQVGSNEELPATADTVIDLTGQIVLPGFVNTHHHLNQTLTRNLPAAQNNNLFPWLQAQYGIWARTNQEASRASTLIGLAELALSGCTTVFDHTYIFKNGNNVDCQIEAAKDIGVRFHCSRGSMSLGQSQGRVAAGRLRGGRSVHPPRQRACHQDLP